LGVITEETKAYLEPVEHIAEATLAFAMAEPQTMTAQIAMSYQYLDKIRRSTRSLDGTKIIQERAA
jgi:hypothetical protein